MTSPAPIAAGEFAQACDNLKALIGRARAQDAQLRHAEQAARDAARLPFLPWVERNNFTADREPVDLKQTWRSLREVYEALSGSPKDFYGVLRKPAQFGGSIAAQLKSLHLALGRRCEIAYFLPVATMALNFSGNRFIRLCRENPQIYALMGDWTKPGGVAGAPDEGSAHVRRIHHSLIHFTYTGGVISTESNPLDGIILDEVQVMLDSEMERIRHRLDASEMKFELYVSTPNFPEADIDKLYQRTDRREFFTHCRCAEGVNLAEHWDWDQGPLCIDRGSGSSPGDSVPREPFFFCPRCGEVLRDPQEGRFVPTNPGSRKIGFSWSQCISPRQTAASLLESWNERVDTKDFWNRRLGRPGTDPKTQPITQQVMAAAQDPNLQWGPPLRTSAAIDGVFMGIDQMKGSTTGNYFVVKGRERDTGRMRLLHLEIVQADDPWLRAAGLMHEYRVRYCAVESLPNTDASLAFAKQFDGKVFVVDSYGTLQEQELVLWGDRPRDKVSVRKVDKNVRLQWTARVDQYRMMAWTLNRWAKRQVSTPDARTLTQYVRGPHGLEQRMICQDIFWRHMQSVALVLEIPEGAEKKGDIKVRRAVKKIGSADPHFAFADMLCNVAWLRANATSQMLFDEQAVAPPTKRDTSDNAQVRERLPGLFDRGDEPAATCGTCGNFDPVKGWCSRILMRTTASLPRCEWWVSQPPEETYP